MKERIGVQFPKAQLEPKLWSYGFQMTGQVLKKLRQTEIVPNWHLIDRCSEDRFRSEIVILQNVRAYRACYGVKAH